MVSSASNVIMATGRRKTAVARIHMVPGTGLVSVNGRDFEDYFTTPAMKTHALLPLQTVDSLKKFDVKVKAHGGGLVGQAGALSLAWACFAAIPARRNARSRVSRARASASSSPSAKLSLGSRNRCWKEST